MQPAAPADGPQPPVRVSLLALPESFLSCLTGLYDTFNVAATTVVPGRLPFEIEIVAQRPRIESVASGLPIVAHRVLGEVERSDVVIVPAAAVEDDWAPGRHPDVVAWLRAMYERGALVSSACSGALLLAEAGLLDGAEATTHWNEAGRFRSHFPQVRLRLERELVVSGAEQRIVTAGASSAWHDLALYLVARYSGADVAREVARFFMLQWHRDGQTPYLGFEPETDHGDAAVLRAQAWLEAHCGESGALAGMASSAELAERTFTRRFRKATGHSPSAYLQQLRIQRAKQLLESTEQPVESVCWAVGYDDPASFRRLFKRLTGVTPGAYRRRFATVPGATRSRARAAARGGAAAPGPSPSPRA